MFQVGYYTEVAGLGFMPQDTVINGAIDVFNNLCTAGNPSAQDCSVVFQDYCANNNFASGGFIADSKVSGNLRPGRHGRVLPERTALRSAQPVSLDGQPNPEWFPFPAHAGRAVP